MDADPIKWQDFLRATPQRQRSLAIAAAYAAADEKLCYVYNPDGERVCRYVEDGAPSCLVGHVLHDCGLSLDTLSSADDGSLGGAGIGSCGYTLGLHPATVVMLAAMQGAQDKGATWGMAIDVANAVDHAFMTQEDAAAVQ